MNATDLKEKMMKLWKDTFHDSDQYIQLIFDNYFNPEFVEYHEEDNRLISALMGIPYTFGNSKYKVNALYLCGLATISEFRHRGIMNNLLENINDKALKKGFSFTFLIPANEGLINYYALRKYETAIYRIEDRYTDIHNFYKDYQSSLDDEDERITTLKERLYSSINIERLKADNYNECENLTKYIHSYEDRVSTYMTLIHSEKDVELLIKENTISGGQIYVSYNRQRQLTGAVFMSVDDKKRIRIPKIYYEDQASFYKLLDYIKRKYPDYPMSIYCYPEECNRKALWEKVYGASEEGMPGSSYGIAERVYNVSSHAKPYGMIRVLNLYEILKFVAIDKSDAKFSILVNLGHEGENVAKCGILDGNVIFELLDEDKIIKLRESGSATILNEREFMEMLFRKKGSSNFIQEAFGVPRLPINMALLLD